MAGRSQPAFCARSESSETGVLQFGGKSGGRPSTVVGAGGGALDCAFPLRTMTCLRIGAGVAGVEGDFLFFAAVASRLAADGVGGFSLPIRESREAVEVATFENCCFLCSAVCVEMESSGEAAFRPLNVKDALSYLDRVKVTFANQSEGEFPRRELHRASSTPPRVSLVRSHADALPPAQSTTAS